MRRHALGGAALLGKSYGSCGGIPPVVTPGGGSWDVGGGGGGGTSPPAAPAPRPITGVKCFPTPVRK